MAPAIQSREHCTFLHDFETLLYKRCILFAHSNLESCLTAHLWCDKLRTHFDYCFTLTLRTLTRWLLKTKLKRNDAQHVPNRDAEMIQSVATIFCFLYKVVINKRSITVMSDGVVCLKLLYVNRNGSSDVSN